MGISTEDYLKSLYMNQAEEGLVKASVVAASLHVSTAAVTDMFKKLGAKGLIDYAPYKGARLTKEGHAIGQGMVRRHRVWEMYLKEVLGYSWDEVHDEAERLEHASSDRLVDRLDEKLGFPKFDPHGDPIPSKTGVIPEVSDFVALSQLEPGESGEVARVSDDDRQFLTHVTDKGISLGKRIKLIEAHSFDRSATIEVEGRQVTLTQYSLQHIFVRR